MKLSPTFEKSARSRVIIESVSPSVDQGRYAVKRTEGEWLQVQADVFTDGHDLVRAVLLYRTVGSKKWSEMPMHSAGNDRWSAALPCNELGHFEYAVKAFIDHPLTWKSDFPKRVAANDPKEVEVQLQIGIAHVEAIQKKHTKARAAAKKWIAALASPEAVQAATSVDLDTFIAQYPLEIFPTQSAVFPYVVHRKKAGFSAWYSFFPRSGAKEGAAHGTFDDCIDLLPRIKELGFDVVYFPPIHPIGDAFRKGKNNTLDIQPGEPGCPYATGLGKGGHKDILPELGTLKDFIRFIEKARELDLEVAMDFAIQCSPDHPYVKEHPQWFKWRPDGSVQYAENPPKKYQDVLPLDFECEDYKAMWAELKSILEYWISKGISIFRVDNPHTKSFVFWEWCLEEIDREFPEVIFLAEAFTRPRIMENLAKKGYHQSYTYFTWRNSKAELQQYMHELTNSPMREYFRPNFWPNTHDILPYILQSGHEPQFIVRYFLAATLSSNYGIFGPTYELMVNAALPGKEEYLDSEKYEVRHWNWEHRNKLMHVMMHVNKARKENEALQHTNNYQSCAVDNEQLMAWVKTYGNNRILCVANLDTYNKQSGWVNLPLHELGIGNQQTYTVHDLLTDEKYMWTGAGGFVELDPYRLPFHLFRIEG